MERKMIYQDDAIDAIVGCTNCGTEDELRAYVTKHSLENGWTGGIVDALDAIEQLPSEQQERAVKDCRNCGYGGYNDHYGIYFCYCADKCRDWDKWKPSEQQERPTGEWIVSESEEVGALGIRCKTYTCPSCGWDNSLIIPRNFCPNCGVRTVQEGEDNDS